MAEQRRLAAILAADMVGYSRLMEADERETIARQKGHRAELIDPNIAEHHGRIVKTTGDGMLVEFASVVDAVECAVAIQRAMATRETEIPEERRIRYRVGINLGDIVIEGDDIFGDGVNIAARLEEMAAPGGISISGTAYDHLKRKVDVGYEFLGAQQVKNIAEPVRAYRVLIESSAAGMVIGDRTPRSRSRQVGTLAVAVGIVIALAGGALWWFKPWAPAFEPASVERMAHPLPDKPSIAVLPFANMSDDPSQAYFADGMTDDLITDLSKISGLFVIARNSTFAYKGRPVDIRQVAEELGVRYVLEGSIRRSGNQIRINAQLIDATTGGHLWAERYDGALTDVFALQDAVTQKIVAALAVSLTDQEELQQARKYTDNADAYDAFLQGWEYYRRFSADDFVKAIPLFEKAVQLDPSYGRAYAALASLYWESIRQGESWTLKVSPDAAAATIVSRGQSRIKADKYLDLAMKDPSPLAHQVASARLWEYRQFDDAIAEAEQAVTLDPNDPDGHVALAWAMIFNGRPQAALAAIERAMRLDPQNTGGHYSYVLGLARLGLDQHQDALAALQRARERSPDYLDVNLALAAAYAHLGRLDEARTALVRYQETWRNFATNFDGVMGRWPFRREADIRRSGDALIKAGLGSEEELNDYIDLLRLGGTLE